MPWSQAGIAIQQLVQQIVPNSSIAQFLIHLSAVFVFLCLHRWGFIIGMLVDFCYRRQIPLGIIWNGRCPPAPTYELQALVKALKKHSRDEKKNNRTKKTNKHRV